MGSISILLLVCAIGVGEGTDIKTLKLVDTNSSLPMGVIGASIVYDGQDSIYVLGGTASDGLLYQDQVIKYSLKSGNVMMEGKFESVVYGTSVLHDEHILYFDVVNPMKKTSSNVYRYSTVSHTTDVIHTFGEVIQGMGAAWDSASGIAYFLGGTTFSQGNYKIADKILEYNVTMNTVTDEHQWQDARFLAAAVWDPSRQLAFLMGGIQTSGNRMDVMQFVPHSLKVEPTGINLPVYIDSSCCSVLVGGRDDSRGSFVYIIGANTPSTTHPVIRIDIDGGRAELIPVELWPDTWLEYVGCAYVPKLHRIYIFGGMEDDGKHRARTNITYLDLGDVPPAPGPAPKKHIHVVTIAIVAAVTVAVVIFGATIAAFIFYRKKRRAGAHVHESLESLVGDIGGTDTEAATPHRQNETINEFLRGFYDNKYELDIRDLTIDKSSTIGEGQVGIVYKGQYVNANAESGTQTVAVAVKMVRPRTSTSSQESDLKSLLTELKLLIYLGPHPHLVNFIGASTMELSQGNLLLVTEFCPLGNLESFMQKHANDFKSIGAIRNSASNPVAPAGIGWPYIAASDLNSVTITTCDLFLWSAQIASAMCFLTEKKVVHGDLATRNILLRNKQTAKVTDFGLGRKTYAYPVRSHASTMPLTQTETALPWRSLAPEVLTEMKFSSQSDVWAFGVTLWEIFSLGKVPFTAVLDFPINFVQQLRNGRRLPKPEHASNKLYFEMLRCWNIDPLQRPSFPGLQEKMDEMRRQCLSNRT